MNKRALSILALGLLLVTGMSFALGRLRELQGKVAGRAQTQAIEAGLFGR